MKLKDIIRNNPFTIIAIVFATIVSGITFLFSKTAAVTEFVVVVIIAVLDIVWMSNTIERKKTFLRVLNRSFSEEGDEKGITESFPLAAAIVNGKGEIEWFNMPFDEVIDADDDFSCGNIKEIISDWDKKIVSEDNKPFEYDAGKKKFTVYYSKLQEDLYAVYFVNDTGLKNIRNEYFLTRPAVLLLNADSLDHAEEQFSHGDYYTITSETEKIVTNWFVKYNCVFRKYTDGKFIAFTEKKNLDAMIKDNFDILDLVREYRLGDQDVDLTISIGIGRDEDFYQCELHARQALDMARGRGGDQVAMKVDDGYEFFGGITSGKEKKGKIKSRIVSAALTELIENSSSVIISGHLFSDFDCLGAAVGVAAMVRACKKNVYIAVNKQNSLAKPMISMVESSGSPVAFISPEKAAEIANDETLLIITDTMRAALVDASALLSKKLKTVVIDHHRMTVDHITDAALTFHEPYASSASEMVTELIQYSASDIKLSVTDAQALLAGILLDTKNFTLRVGVRTFEAAAFLREKKADTVVVRKLFAGTAEENINIGKIINTAKFYNNYVIARADFAHPQLRLLCSKAADSMLDIKDIDASFVLSEANGSVSCSARSLGKVGVHLIMEKFGGGGHQSMAACRMDNCTLDEAEQKLVSAIREYYEKNSISNGGKK